jgi:hypothetical protein
MENFDLERPIKRRPPSQRQFVITPDPRLQKNLLYFMQQELGYYNTLVTNFNARVKAFPQDILAIRDRDIKLLETCGQFAYDPDKLLSTDYDKWPEAFKSYQSIVYLTEGKTRISERTLGIMKIATVPAHIHHQVRRNMISEVFATVSSQANIFLAAKNTEQLRAPVQMMQPQTWETKHHLQVPKSLIEMNYNDDTNWTLIKTPYNKEWLTVLGYDLTAIPYNTMVIKSPIPGEDKPTWRIEFKDQPNKYLLNLTDPRPYKKKRRT